MNPITDFNAREFLLFYAVFIMAAWMARRWFIRHSDRTLDDAWTPPRVVDPYDVAYLRGGASELARVAVVGLAERGYLDVGPAAVVRASPHPDPARLTSLDAASSTSSKACARPGRLPPRLHCAVA